MTKKPMRKLILKTVLVLAGVVFAVALVFWLFFGVQSDRLDTFHVLDAELSDPGELLRPHKKPAPDASYEEFADWARPGVSAHRLKAGKGTVLGYRFFSAGSPAVIDDERYRKLTVWMLLGAMPASLQVAEFPLSVSESAGPIVLASRGGSAWPENDCSGRLAAGSLRIERQGGNYKVAVHGLLQPSEKSASNGRCAPQRVDLEFTTTPLTIRQMTPWLGADADHPYAETYPR